MARGLFSYRLPIFLCMTVFLTACGGGGGGNSGSSDGGTDNPPAATSTPASVLATIPVANAGVGECLLAVNSTTNKIYVCSNPVTVIDGNTNSATATVQVGPDPMAIAVNSTTNKIYVAKNDSGSITVIDGVTNNTTTVSASPATIKPIDGT